MYVVKYLIRHEPETWPVQNENASIQYPVWFSNTKVSVSVFNLKNERFKYIFPPSKQHLSGFSYVTFSVLINFATLCRSDKGDVVLASVRVVRCWRQWWSSSGLDKNQFVNTSTFIDYSITLFYLDSHGFCLLPSPHF